jgi:hypothetical protein
MQVPRDGLVAKLQKLSQSQQSIESVSSFCVFYHKDARGVVNIWEEEFFKAPNDRKMALLYLANHILQEGRRKGTGFQDEFYRVLPKAMQHALGGGDERVKRAVSRLVAIWEERRVFGTRHIKSFQGLVGGGGAGAAGLPAGAGGGGGYQPAKKAGGGGGSGSGGGKPGVGGDAVAAAARAAAAAAEKRKTFEAAWRPVGCERGGKGAAALPAGRASPGGLWRSRDRVGAGAALLDKMQRHELRVQLLHGRPRPPPRHALRAPRPSLLAPHLLLSGPVAPGTRRSCPYRGTWPQSPPSAATWKPTSRRCSGS